MLIGGANFPSTWLEWLYERGLPRHVKEFTINVATDKLVSVKCEFLVYDGDKPKRNIETGNIEIDEKEYYLIEKSEYRRLLSIA